jgi:hypothetical protein
MIRHNVARSSVNHGLIEVINFNKSQIKEKKLISINQYHISINMPMEY